MNTCPCERLLGGLPQFSHKFPASTRSLHVTSAQARYAAEETARKAAAVREQLKHHSSKHARQIHEHNAHIAELQQKAAVRAVQQQAAQQQHKQSPQLQKQHQQGGQLQLEVSELQQGFESTSRKEHARSVSVTRVQPASQAARSRLSSQQQQQLRREREQLQMRIFKLRQSQRARKQQQQQPDPQRDFYEMLRGVEVLVRSNSTLDWQQAVVQLQRVVVPAVSDPLAAQAAWRVMNSLAGRPLDAHSSGGLGSAVAALVKVSLSHSDFSMLRQLLSSGRRFSLGPRQLHTLITTAAAAGADSDSLAALLDLTPPSQLANRAFYAVILTAVNRRHYQVAQQCLQRLQDRGLALSPGLQRLQQRVQAGVMKLMTR